MNAGKVAIILGIVLSFTGQAKAEGFDNTVIASWYGGDYGGRHTASGEVFNPGAMTAAHPFLPFGTMLEVRSVDTGRSVVVRINDRGPHNGRGIDLSEAAARHIGLWRQGIGEVTLHPLESQVWQ